MKISIYSRRDSGGGAARSAYRLFKGLRNYEKCSANMIVGSSTVNMKGIIFPKNKNQKMDIILSEKMQGLQCKFINSKKEDVISSSRIGTKFTKELINDDSDILNIHWINNGFLSLNNLKKVNKPLIMTMHDSWLFTGGCHLPFECRNYEYNCNNCPRIKERYHNIFINKEINNKINIYNNSNIVFVTPSNWLREKALSSTVLHDRDIRVIPNGLEIESYKVINKKNSRQILGVNPNKRYLLFGAISATSSKNKGFHILKQTVEKLWYKLKESERNEVELLIFGTDSTDLDKEFKFKVNVLGKLNDDIALNIAYSAADIFILPSLTENLPNTVLEAMASGTPSIAFNQGGLPDLIINGENGYLVTPYNSDEMAEIIKDIIFNEYRIAEMAKMGREKFESNFTIDKVSKQYVKLFDELLKNRW